MCGDAAAAAAAASNSKSKLYSIKTRDGGVGPLAVMLKDLDKSL